MHGTSVEHNRALLRHVLNTVLAEQVEDGRKAAPLEEFATLSVCQLNCTVA